MSRGLRHVAAVTRLAVEIGVVVVVPWAIAASVGGAAGVLLAAAGTLGVLCWWGRLIAPRAAHRLPDPGRGVAEMVVFGAAAWSVGVLAGSSAALVAGMVAVASAVAVRLTPE